MRHVYVMTKCDVKIGQYSSIDCDQEMICLMVFLWSKIWSTQFFRIF